MKDERKNIEFKKVVEMVMPDKYEIPVEEIRTDNQVETKTTHCLDCYLICENH